MSVILTEECIICDHPNVLQINEDLLMKVSYPLLCERNGLPYTKETIKQLVNHQLKHIYTPSVALARSMLHDEAVQLKNTAIETNLALDQIDIMLMKIYEEIKSVVDLEILHKLTKNFTDLQKIKNDYLKFHHKISGKELIDDLRKASLTETVKAVGKELGDDAVRQIQKDNKKKRSIQEFLMADEYMNELYDEYNIEDDDDVDNKSEE